MKYTNLTLDKYIEYARKKKYRDSRLLVCDNCKARTYCNIFKQIQASSCLPSPLVSLENTKGLGDSMKDSLEFKRKKCLRNRRRIFRRGYPIFDLG